MRKWLTNMTVLLTISSSALPLTGCTFNFYVNKVKDKVSKNLAIQTSSIIKSLIISKDLDSDTQVTISDTLSYGSNDSIIQNHSRWTTINDWGQFRNNWGYNQDINISGFDQDSFIVANGSGSLTKKINSLRSTNEILDYLSYINVLNVLDNQTLYGVVLGKNAVAKPIIKNFLKELKNENLPEPYLQLVKNIINNYQTSLLDPITILLNDLVAGWGEALTPATLKTYMDKWKDGDQPYSEWSTDDGWKMDTDFYDKWKGNDISLYRGSVFINYLFKKIGNDNKDKIETPQYLGEIISANITASEPGDAILQALQPYLDLLLTNPKYVLQLVTGLIPLIKKVIFGADDLTKGIKKLTFGNKYPTDKTSNSYNVKETFLGLKSLLSDRETVEKTVETIVTSPLLYDIKVDFVIEGPLGFILSLQLKPIRELREKIVKLASDLLTGPDFMNILDSILNVITELNDQFPDTDGINLDLENLKNILLNETNGLLILLKDVADTIANIIKPNPNYADDDDDDDNEITDEQVEELYQSIGGQLPSTPGSQPPIDFKPNSILWVLKNELSNNDSDLSKLAKIISRTDNYKGVANIIIDQNEAWIEDNYVSYLRSDYSKTNITNIKYETSEDAKQKTINISYEFFYEINSVEYHFFIKGIVVDNKETFLGTHNFKFTDIQLL